MPGRRRICSLQSSERMLSSLYSKLLFFILVFRSMVSSQHGDRKVPGFWFFIEDRAWIPRPIPWNRGWGKITKTPTPLFFGSCSALLRSFFGFFSSLFRRFFLALSL